MTVGLTVGKITSNTMESNSTSDFLNFINRKQLLVLGSSSKEYKSITTVFPLNLTPGAKTNF